MDTSRSAGPRYGHLRPEERVSIAGLAQCGHGVRQIAEVLGRAASTISRELARNATALPAEDGFACGAVLYDARVAERLAQRRRRAGRPPRKLAPDSLLLGLMHELLSWAWSPQQIAAILRRMAPDDASQRVSHETIYNAIYAQPRGELRKELISYLRHGHTKRLPRTRGTDRRGSIPEAVSIHLRPPEVDDRLMPGHWEGDLIKGARNASAVGVLVERTTRLVLLAKVEGSTAAAALEAFTRKLQSIAEPMRHTLTYDRGTEMARHVELTRRTKVAVYFADPHSPWQRGTCENTNGLIRQFLPKGTDLSVHSQDDLDRIADLLNNRPRQTLGWNTPLATFRHLLETTHAQHGTVQ
jgi:IS30 family transposase